MAGRFIKLYEKILDWEWFNNANTLHLFLYLLLKANYKDATFQGIKVKRGQFVTSLSKLSQATGQSIRMVRDNLNHLELTGEVTSQATNRYRIITIVKYDEYQSSDKQNDKQTTSKPTSKLTGKTTSQTATSIEYIETIETIENRERCASRFTPPTKQQILDYCREQGIRIDAEMFVNHYESNGWMVGRNRMKDWKATVRNWAKREENGNGGYGQHRGAAEGTARQDYSDLRGRA